MENVSSVADSGVGYLYGSKINDILYTYKLDAGATNIFLSISATTKLVLKIRPRTNLATLGDGTAISIAGMTTTSICVGVICSEEEVPLVPSEEDTGVLRLGRPWGQKHSPRLGWIDLSTTRNKNDGTTVLIRPKNVNRGGHTMQRSSFKQMIKTLRKGHCKPYMPRVSKCEYGVADSSSPKVRSGSRCRNHSKTSNRNFWTYLDKSYRTFCLQKGHLNLRYELIQMPQRQWDLSSIYLFKSKGNWNGSFKSFLKKGSCNP